MPRDTCKQRCDRIHQRSLGRVGFDNDKLRHLLETQRPLGTLRDVCWRVYDHLDCMKQCDHKSPEHEEFADFVRSKCRFALKAMEGALTCVSRYHSFMEVRCMMFLKEAEALKAQADPSYTPDQHICRYLHLNTLCLENTVTMYCANAKKLFRRLNFRDYFPNFILPSNDTLFDDLDLDACQLFDFVKQNTKQQSEAQLDKELTTVINYLESKHDVTRPMIVTTAATISQERREFTTLLEELLDETETTSSEATTNIKPSTNSTKTTLRPYRTTQKSHSSTTQMPYTTMTTMAPKSSSSVTTTSSTTTTTTTPVPTTTPISVPTATSTDVTESTSSSDLTNDDGDEYGEVEADPLGLTIDKGTGATDEESKPTSTARSRVFSEDSWEYTPPNFRYSSMRNGGVTPLAVDTSTLFGMDDEDDSEEDSLEDVLEDPLGKDVGDLEEITRKEGVKVDKGTLEKVPPTEKVGGSKKNEKGAVDGSKGSNGHKVKGVKAVISQEK
ncbi:hypothetical protein GCK32_013458, partial [Trichostrongylus colubriformis]